MNNIVMNEGLVLARIKELKEGEILTLKTPNSIEDTLNKLKSRRFSGLKWKQSELGSEWIFEIQNEDTDDCCGCCGGN